MSHSVHRHCSRASPGPWPASYQDVDIVIIKGFSSSRLLNRFESMKDEKNQNSTTKLSSNSSRLALSIHSNIADK
ncbi:hypothetical protein VZT92_001577 [Zoarces viviparus]|uniref:Uncharacterized protein n=1 Tax=Zoarces viviparus TaxID=48416 RepID=A0AAW1G429_ZOAVI